MATTEVTRTERKRESVSDLIGRLESYIETANRKLDLIFIRIEKVDADLAMAEVNEKELEKVVNNIVEDLRALDWPIACLREDVEILKEQRHPDADDYYEKLRVLQQRRTEYHDRSEIGQMDRLREIARTTNYGDIRKTIFSRAEETLARIRAGTQRATTNIVEQLENLNELRETDKLDQDHFGDFCEEINTCVHSTTQINEDDKVEYRELVQTISTEFEQLFHLSFKRTIELNSLFDLLTLYTDL